MNSEDLLKHLAKVARGKFKLTVWQWLPGEVGGHSATSYHKRTFPDGVGQAFDAYGGRIRMARFAWHLRKNYRQHLSEGIHNTGVFGRNLSVKHGQNVAGAEFWGSDIWAEHKNHVHVARGPEV